MSATLKHWLVCRLWQQFPSIQEAREFKRTHPARLLEVTSDTDGRGSVWAVEHHCEREHTAHARLADIAAAKVPGVFLVMRAEVQR